MDRGRERGGREGENGQRGRGEGRERMDRERGGREGENGQGGRERGGEKCRGGGALTIYWHCNNKCNVIHLSYSLIQISFR